LSKTGPGKAAGLLCFAPEADKELDEITTELRAHPACCSCGARTISGRRNGSPRSKGSLRL